MRSKRVTKLRIVTRKRSVDDDRADIRRDMEAAAVVLSDDRASIRRAMEAAKVDVSDHLSSRVIAPRRKKP